MWDRIRYLATPAPRYLRDMGYVRGLKRLDARGGAVNPSGSLTWRAAGR